MSYMDSYANAYAAQSYRSHEEDDDVDMYDSMYK